MARQNQYADSDAVSPSPSNSPNNNIGNGLSGGMHHADADLSGDARYRQNRIINSTDSDYAGNSANVASRTSVDVSRADRGSEA